MLARVELRRSAAGVGPLPAPGIAERRDDVLQVSRGSLSLSSGAVLGQDRPHDGGIMRAWCQRLEALQPHVQRSNPAAPVMPMRCSSSCVCPACLPACLDVMRGLP